MNTLAWFGLGAPSSFWLATFSFNTLSWPILGYAWGVMFVVCLAGGVVGAAADWDILMGKRE